MVGRIAERETGILGLQKYHINIYTETEINLLMEEEIAMDTAYPGSRKMKTSSTLHIRVFIQTRSEWWGV